MKRRMRNKNERGFTLLEYCAGAAAVMVVLFAAMNTFSTNISTFLGKINTKLTTEGDKIK